MKPKSHVRNSLNELNQIYEDPLGRQHICLSPFPRLCAPRVCLNHVVDTFGLYHVALSGTPRRRFVLPRCGVQWLIEIHIGALLSTSSRRNLIPASIEGCVRTRKFCIFWTPNEKPSAICSWVDSLGSGYQLHLVHHYFLCVERKLTKYWRKRL